MVGYLVSSHELIFLENQSTDVAFPIERDFMWLPPYKSIYCVLVLAFHFLYLCRKSSLKYLIGIRKKCNVSRISKFARSAKKPAWLASGGNSSTLLHFIPDNVSHTIVWLQCHILKAIIPLRVQASSTTLLRISRAHVLEIQWRRRAWAGSTPA